MKYFTPQRYVDFNSDDPAIADQADEAWEQALAAYRRDLAAIRSLLPDDLREFAEDVNLHDGHYLGFIKAAVPGSAGELAVVGVEKDDELLLLFYVLADERSLSRPIDSAVFADGETQWLYDEVGLSGEGAFSHEVLLSNGKVLSLDFVAFDLLRVSKNAFRFPRAADVTAAAG